MSEQRWSTLGNEQHTPVLPLRGSRQAASAAASRRPPAAVHLLHRPAACARRSLMRRAAGDPYLVPGVKMWVDSFMQETVLLPFTFPDGAPARGAACCRPAALPLSPCCRCVARGPFRASCFQARPSGQEPAGRARAAPVHLPPPWPSGPPAGFTYDLTTHSVVPVEKPEGLLEVAVVEARNVPRMDFFGKVRRRGRGGLALLLACGRVAAARRSCLALARTNTPTWSALPLCPAG